MLFNIVVKNLFSIFNGVNIYPLKAKEFEIKPHALCFRNILNSFTVNSMKKNWYIWKMYYFSVDYNSIVVDDILDIHKYLMNK